MGVPCGGGVDYTSMYDLHIQFGLGLTRTRVCPWPMHESIDLVKRAILGSWVAEWISPMTLVRGVWGSIPIPIQPGTRWCWQ